MVDDSLSEPASRNERPWWTQRRRSLLWLTCVLVGCVAGFALVYRLTVHTVPGRIFGDIVLRRADLGASRSNETVAALLDVVTVTSMAAAVALVAIIALIRMRRAMGLAAVLVLVISSVLSRILKAYVLSRPDLGLDESTPATLNSLPSGHATAAFSVVAALLFVVPVGLRPAMAALGVMGSSTIAFATMFAGWHRAADSLASFLLVTGVAAAVAMGVLFIEGLPDEDPGPTDPPGEPADRAGAKRASRWPAVLSVGLLGLSGLLVAALANPTVRDSRLGAPAAFLAAGLMIVGTSIATTALVLRTVDRISPRTQTMSMPDPVPPM